MTSAANGRVYHRQRRIFIALTMRPLAGRGLADSGCWRMPELHLQYISGHTAVKKRLVQHLSAQPGVSTAAPGFSQSDDALTDE